MVQSFQHSVSLFVTSRPNLDLEGIFSPMSQICISAHADDLQVYIESIIDSNSKLFLYIARDQNLRADIVKTVVDKAKGMCVSLISIFYCHLTKLPGSCSRVYCSPIYVSKPAPEMSEKLCPLCQNLLSVSMNLQFRELKIKTKKTNI